MESFGESGDANELFKKFGFTIKGIKQKVFDMVGSEYIETNIDGCEI